MRKKIENNNNNSKKKKESNKKIQENIYTQVYKCTHTTYTVCIHTYTLGQ